MEREPLVSVFCPTYNHEKFIRQCLEGIVMQKTDFPIELFVQDDASTDKTPLIVKEYAEKHDFIIPVLHSENHYSKGKSLNEYFFRNAKGKYIALCEGDDYWTDPFKLQKQVDFLEGNEDFAICHHNMQVIYEDGREPHLSNSPDQKEVTTIEDLAKGNYIYTASCVYRNGLIKEFPDWFKDAPVGDYVLHMLNAQYGKIKYITDVMGVYRVHKDGIWSNQNYILKIFFYQKILVHLIAEISLENKETLKTQLLNYNLTMFNIIEDYKKEVHKLNMLYLSKGYKLVKLLLRIPRRIWQKTKLL